MKKTFRDRQGILAILLIMASVLIIIASFAVPGKRTYVGNESSRYNEYIPEYLDKDDPKIIDNRAVIACKQEQKEDVISEDAETVYAQAINPTTDVSSETQVYSTNEIAEAGSAQQIIPVSETETKAEGAEDYVDKDEEIRNMHFETGYTMNQRQ